MAREEEAVVEEGERVGRGMVKGEAIFVRGLMRSKNFRVRMPAKKKRRPVPFAPLLLVATEWRAGEADEARWGQG